MHSPHDTLFGFTFRHPHHAAGWVRHVLPHPLGTVLREAELAPIRERFPGVRLRPHVADAGFAARIVLDGDGFDVLLLLEHKSYEDKAVWAQLLRYTIHVQRALQEHSVREPFVLAVLLRHGETPETEVPPLDPLRRALVAAQPRQQVFVDDLSLVDEGAIAARDQTPLATLTQLCLKALPSAEPDDVPRFFDRWQHLLRLVDHVDAPPQAPPLGPDAVDAVGWYALAVTNVDSLALSETFCRILQRDEDTIMSTLERTHQKGLHEGLTKGLSRGRTEGKAEALLRQLTRRFGPLDAAATQRVATATADEIDVWLDRVLDAVTIDDVLAR